MKISIATPWGMNFSGLGESVRDCCAAIVARKESYSVPTPAVALWLTQR
jgi:hypothetical protein